VKVLRAAFRRIRSLAMRRVPLALFALLPALACAHAAIAQAAPATPATSSWCAPEVETLPGGVCHVDGRREGRRTLVVFLHGLIARGTTWQWTQHRAMARNAKNLGFAVIMPTAPAVGPGGSAGYAWPGAPPAREIEQALIDNWLAAQRLLEERNGQPFDEVFVMGFSSGAYYATSLALRGRLDVNGYALFAGGATSSTPGPEVRRHAPIFVGVCARNPETAVGARTLGASLAAWKWPSRVDEQPIGHMFGDAHVAHALAYLRGRVTPKI
jgi:pimeloyl-ACP methyl ester carboxylesterase